MEDMILTDERIAENSAERLFIALCRYLGVPEDKSADSYIATSLGAMEYATIVAKSCGVNEGAFMESVGNIWRKVHGEGTVREQGQVREEEDTEVL
tara:strand:+ start:96 stop:383 length:288 start_codon:yes stop_codon:yes gene_type:complete